MDDGAGERIWYVAYGSNLCRDRLMAYLEGTVAPLRRDAAGGAERAGPRKARYGAHRGCSDPTPPADDRWLDIGHRVSFRGTSRRWGGGVAFVALAPEPGVATEVRAWLLTAAQVLGVAAQEGRLAEVPGRALLDRLTHVGATAALGGGWYDTILRLPDVEGRMALTVTTSRALPATETTEPYLATIAAGRAERPDRSVRPAPTDAP